MAQRSAFAAVMLLTVFAPLAARESHSAQHLGDVHFETSCTEAAQSHFDRGMRYQHSFWYRESRTSFEEALRADPKCTIAYWGIAQSLMANPFNPTPPKNLAEGQALIQKARQLGAGTEREADLIRAVGAFYADFDTLTQRTRAQSYDYPALAAKGLDAAVRYARIAEAAPHAQHMPSHIFTRVGRWSDSIARTAPRRDWPGPGTNPTIAFTPWTTWSTPTCSWPGTARRARSSTR